MTTTPTPPAPAGDPTPPPAPTPTPAPVQVKADDASEVRYCLYDNTYKRFVGPVTTERPNKAAVKRVAEQHNLDVDRSDLVVREV